MLNFKILSVIKFIRSKRTRAGIEGIYYQFMKTNAFNLEKSLIDEVLSQNAYIII